MVTGEAMVVASTTGVVPPGASFITALVAVVHAGCTHWLASVQ